MKRFVLYGILFLVLLLSGCSLILANMNATMPNLNGKPDGIYRGENNQPPIPLVILDVTVQNERLVKIDIVEHYHSPIGKQAEKIIPEIIKHQSLDVDVVSGATASSKSILKAVENALQ